MSSTIKKFLPKAIASAVLLAAAASAQAEQVTLRFHQMLPAPATIPRHAIKPWIEDVEKASNGELKIKQYDGMTLGGKPPELFGQAKDGVVDLIWTVLGYTPGLFPKTEVFELPFMTTNALSSSKAIQAYVTKNAMDEFKDVKLICVHTHGAGMLHTAMPVTKMEDMSGKKIRGGSRVINDMLTKLGATPVGMPVTSIAESLSKGVVDGTLLPWEVLPAFKIQQIVKNHTNFSDGAALYTSTFGVVMNKAKYESLNATQKAAIDQFSGQSCAERFGTAMDKGDEGAKALAVKAGNKLMTIDATEQLRWERNAAAVADEWVGRSKAAGFDGAAMLKDAKALIKQYQ